MPPQHRDMNCLVDHCGGPCTCFSAALRSGEMDLEGGTNYKTMYEISVHDRDVLQKLLAEKDAEIKSLVASLDRAKKRAWADWGKQQSVEVATLQERLKEQDALIALNVSLQESIKNITEASKLAATLDAQRISALEEKLKHREALLDKYAHEEDQRFLKETDPRSISDTGECEDPMCMGLPECVKHVGKTEPETR